MNRKNLTLTMALALIATPIFAKNISMDPKVIYGEDNRVAPSEVIDSTLKTISNSTAAMIGWDKMNIYGDRVDLSDNMTLTEDGYFNICSNQRFANEINPANCSGFLIADDILVTAGHCIRSQADCENNAWVFDFVSGDKNAKLSKSKSVYRCTAILASVLDNYDKNDFAVLKLDRSTGREVLPIRTEGKVNADAELYVIGHPSGLPQKIAGGAGVRNNGYEHYFVANLDTFGGNSGSPVIDKKSGMIEGILVRGERDYKYDNELGCNVVYQCENDGCRGEDVTRITSVSKNLKAIVDGLYTGSNLESEDKADLDLDFINDYFFRNILND
jgi:V8-like Glu-specific endopeptidase